MPDEKYFIASSISGDPGNCMMALDAVEVKQPFAPQITPTCVHLNNNSFTVSDEEYRPVSDRPYPAFSLSVKVMNTGLEFNEHLEAALSLIVDGREFPLLIELSDNYGLPYS